MRVQAHFEPAPAGSTLPVLNILNQTEARPMPGHLTVRVSGTLYRLTALKDEGPGFFVVFRDQTAGDTAPIQAAASSTRRRPTRTARRVPSPRSPPARSRLAKTSCRSRFRRAKLIRVRIDRGRGYRESVLNRWVPATSPLNVGQGMAERTTSANRPSHSCFCEYLRSISMSPGAQGSQPEATSASTENATAAAAFAAKASGEKPVIAASLLEAARAAGCSARAATAKAAAAAANAAFAEPAPSRVLRA
jgi:hypothetical protein